MKVNMDVSYDKEISRSNSSHELTYYLILCFYLYYYLSIIGYL